MRDVADRARRSAADAVGVRQPRPGAHADAVGRARLVHDRASRGCRSRPTTSASTSPPSATTPARCSRSTAACSRCAAPSATCARGAYRTLAADGDVLRFARGRPLGRAQPRAPTSRPRRVPGRVVDRGHETRRATARSHAARSPAASARSRASLRPAARSVSLARAAAPRRARSRAISPRSTDSLAAWIARGRSPARPRARTPRPGRPRAAWRRAGSSRRCPSAPRACRKRLLERALGAPRRRSARSASRPARPRSRACAPHGACARRVALDGLHRAHRVGARRDAHGDLGARAAG